MNSSLGNFLEPLEGRRHLAAHPGATPSAPPLTPAQQTQLQAELIAAYIYGLSASTPALATQQLPVNSAGANMLTSSNSPDWLDALGGNSSNPISTGSSAVTTPTNVANAPIPTTTPFDADPMTADSSLYINPAGLP